MKANWCAYHNLSGILVETLRPLNWFRMSYWDQTTYFKNCWKLANIPVMVFPEFLQQLDESHPIHPFMSNSHCKLQPLPSCYSDCSKSQIAPSCHSRTLAPRCQVKTGHWSASFKSFCASASERIFTLSGSHGVTQAWGPLPSGCWCWSFQALEKTVHNMTSWTKRLKQSSLLWWPRQKNIYVTNCNLFIYMDFGWFVFKSYVRSMGVSSNNPKNNGGENDQ